MNPTPLSRFNPFDNLGKKTSPVKQPRFNPFDLKKNKSPSKTKPAGDVSEAAKPVEFEVNVQGKAIVDQGKESSVVIAAVVADLEKESQKEKEKEKGKGKEKEENVIEKVVESEENVIEKVVESENEESGKLVTYKSKKGKKGSVVDDKKLKKNLKVTVVDDKKLKKSVKVTEPVKTTPKKKSDKVISEAPVLTSNKLVQYDTPTPPKKRKLALPKVDDSSKKQKLKVPKGIDMSQIHEICFDFHCLF